MVNKIVCSQVTEPAHITLIVHSSYKMQRWNKPCHILESQEVQSQLLLNNTKLAIFVCKALLDKWFYVVYQKLRFNKQCTSRALFLYLKILLLDYSTIFLFIQGGQQISDFLIRLKGLQTYCDRSDYCLNKHTELTKYLKLFLHTTHFDLTFTHASFCSLSIFKVSS